MAIKRLFTAICAFLIVLVWLFGGLFSVFLFWVFLFGGLALFCFGFF